MIHLHLTDRPDGDFLLGFADSMPHQSTVYIETNETVQSSGSLYIYTDILIY